MYLYFSKARKLQTMIAHGSPIRQGDGFGLYLCFDLDFFDDEQNQAYEGTQDLYCYYKTSSMNRFASEAISVLSKGTIMFKKNSNDEVTYKLVDNDRYLMYYASIVPSNGLTQSSGDLELVFTFERVVVDASTLVGKTQEEIEAIYDAAIRDAVNMSAKLYVEPTFGKNKPKIDTTMNQTNYEQLLAYISDLRKTKNIALEPIESIEGYENISAATEILTKEKKLFARASKIYETWMDTRKGWIILNKTDENIDVCDMYMMFGEDNMFVVSSETGLIYKYTQVNNEYTLVPQTYSVNVFGDNLITFLASQNKENLVELLIDYLQRIQVLERDTLTDIKYRNSKIEYKQNGSYNDLVTNDTLRTDLGITTIERDAVFNVDYTRATNLGESNETPGSFIVKTGQTSSNQEITNTSELKQDMKLDLVDNKASSDNINVVNKSNLVATIRALVDTLENGDSVTVPQYTKMKQRVEYIYQFLQIEGDSDSLVNKIEEIIEVLNTIPENSDIWGTLTNIFDKIGEGEDDTYFYDPDPNLTEEQRQSRTIKGRIDYLYQNADKHIIVFIRYSEPGNRELLTINTSDWNALSNPNPNYPDAEYYTVIDPKENNPENPAFENVIDMEVVFDNTSEMETLVGAEFDLTDEVLYIYSSEIPESTITIDTIKIISNIHHTMSLNVSESDQIADNTDRLDGHDTDISNLNRDKVDKVVVNPNDEDDNSTISHTHNGLEVTVIEDEEQRTYFKAKADGIDASYDDNTYGEQALTLDEDGLTIVTSGGNNELTLDNNGAFKIDSNTITNGQIKTLIVDKTGAKLTFKGSTNYDRKFALINDGDVISNQVQPETYSREKIDKVFQNKIVSTKPQINKENLSKWETKTWTGLTGFGGSNIWTDGENIYYSYEQKNYVLDKATSIWIPKVWNGNSYLFGGFTWTDGENIYYSNSYVLNKSTSTWETKTWNSNETLYVNPSKIWTDGTNIYYSDDTNQYVLNKATSTWETKVWNGINNFDGQYVWTDGENIYYSNGTNQYVLNKSTSTWEIKVWNGLSNFFGKYIWTDGTNIYYSNGTNHYILGKSTSTWITKSWGDFTNFYGDNIWTDGTNIYYNDSYVLKNYQNIHQKPILKDTFESSPFTFLVSSFQNTPDNIHYPSEKLVKDNLDTINTNLNNLNTNKQNKITSYKYKHTVNISAHQGAGGGSLEFSVTFENDRSTAYGNNETDVNTLCNWFYNGGSVRARMTSGTYVYNNSSSVSDKAAIVSVCGNSATELRVYTAYNFGTYSSGDNLWSTIISWNNSMRIYNSWVEPIE
jgi:hypothetical protein